MFELLGLADHAEVLFPHPAVRRRADRIRGDLLLDRGQLAEFERVVVRDRVAPRRERYRVTGARRLPAVEVVEEPSRRLLFLVVVPSLPDVLLNHAIGVLAGMVADVTVPGPIMPHQPCGQMRGHDWPPFRHPPRSQGGPWRPPYLG